MITYEEYMELSAEPMEETYFSSLKQEAEIYLNEWTMSRVTEVTPAVKLALTRVIDGLHSMYSSSKDILEGKHVTAYSDGVSRWSFSDVGSVGECEDICLSLLHSKVVDFLPVELVSRVCES